MAAESPQILLVNGDKEEENNGNENENERNKYSVELKSGGKKEEPPQQEKPCSQPQSWPRPQNRPLPQQHQQNPHQFQQQDISYQGDSQDRRKSVTFGPGVRRDFTPENRLPIQQGVVIRRPSPWAVLRAKLPAGEHLPVLRPGISNEHIIQRMQNPETATRPQSRPPISRPGSQELVRPPYIQRSDSVIGRPPTSPRPSPSPIRPLSRTSSTSKDEEEDVTVNEIRNQSSMMRPTSGQKGSGPQTINLQNQAPTIGQSPIIQIANHPPNMPPPGQMINNQLPRTQQNSIPPNIQPQTQNGLQQNQQAPTPQKGVPPMTQTQFITPPNVAQGSLSSNKPQAPIVSNQTPGPQAQTQGIQLQNLASQQPQNSMHQSLSSQQQPQSQQPQGQIPMTQTQAQISTSNVPAPQTHPQPPKNSAAGNQNFGPQTPSVASAQPNSTQNSVPPSPVGPKRPTPVRNTNTTLPSSPPKSSPSQGLDGGALNKEENKPPQEPESIPDLKKTYDKMNHNKTTEDQKEKASPKKMNDLQDKSLHKPPVVVDATLKRPIDLKSSSVAGKAEETEKTAKENEPPKPENSKTGSTPSKAHEPAVVNGNHELPKTPKAAPPKKLGTAQSPLKSPNRPLPKTPETPGTADKKKVPMNKVQVGAAPSPNLKSVKSKIGSLENAKHKPGGGKVKIEHRKLNFNVSPKIEAKNDTYSPGGGDKKIQQVKLQWNAKPKVGSLDNAAHKPGGGDKKIESVKLDFKDKAKPKVGSKDNIKHIAGGGTVKNSDEHLDGDQCDIEDQKLEINAQSKVGSMDNVKHRPGGGEKKIFDDKEYLKQMATTSTDSLNQEQKRISRCNSTSTQENKPKSEEKTGSKLSLKLDGLQDHTKEKSPQRPIDQNSNQVNDKNISESPLKKLEKEQYHESDSIKSQIKTNGITFQENKKDANGNGKFKDMVSTDLANNGTKQKTQSNELNENQNRKLDNKPSTIPLSSDDRKAQIKPESHHHAHHLQAVNQKEQLSNINFNNTESIVPNQSRTNISPNMPRMPISPSGNPPKNIPGLPPNIRLAKDLINDTYNNEQPGIIEKSVTEGTEKATFRQSNDTATK